MCLMSKRVFEPALYIHIPSEYTESRHMIHNMSGTLQSGEVAASRMSSRSVN